MLLMVSNAMWYGTGANSDVAFKFQLGPLRYDSFYFMSEHTHLISYIREFCLNVGYKLTPIHLLEASELFSEQLGSNEFLHLGIPTFLDINTTGKSR